MNNYEEKVQAKKEYYQQKANSLMQESKDSSIKTIGHELLAKTQEYNKKFLGPYSYVAKVGDTTYFDNRLLKKLVNIIGDVDFNNELKQELREKPLVFYFNGYSSMFKLVQSPLRFKYATEALNKCEPLVRESVC